MRKYHMPSLSQESESSRRFPHPLSKAGLLPLRVFRIQAPLHPTRFTLKLPPRLHTPGKGSKLCPGNMHCPQAAAGTERHAAETFI